jgi:cell division protein FtsZ
MMGTGVGSGENRARMAAESAIASPLLEDVDLSGARGVLVNITAGIDLSIGEFEEVGEVVKGITSEGGATVVVGTVIDPELRDEVRVTVIVTGLGRKQVISSIKMNELPKNAEDGTDYQKLEKPAIMRRNTGTPAVPVVPAVATASAGPAKVVDNFFSDTDYFDIPAFLRRKEEV